MEKSRFLCWFILIFACSVPWLLAEGFAVNNKPREKNLQTQRRNTSYIPRDNDDSTKGTKEPIIESRANNGKKSFQQEELEKNSTANSSLNFLEKSSQNFQGKGNELGNKTIFLQEKGEKIRREQSSTMQTIINSQEMSTEGTLSNVNAKTNTEPKSTIKKTTNAFEVKSEILENGTNVSVDSSETAEKIEQVLLSMEDDDKELELKDEEENMNDEQNEFETTNQDFVKTTEPSITWFQDYGTKLTLTIDNIATGNEQRPTVITTHIVQGPTVDKWDHNTYTPEAESPELKNTTKPLIMESLENKEQAREEDVTSPYVINSRRNTSYDRFLQNNVEKESTMSSPNQTNDSTTNHDLKILEGKLEKLEQLVTTPLESVTQKRKNISSLREINNNKHVGRNQLTQNITYTENISDGEKYTREQIMPIKKELDNHLTKVKGPQNISDIITNSNEDENWENKTGSREHHEVKEIEDSKVEDIIRAAHNEVSFTIEEFQITTPFDLETTVDDKYTTLENESRLNAIIGSRLIEGRQNISDKINNSIQHNLESATADENWGNKTESEEHDEVKEKFSLRNQELRGEKIEEDPEKAEKYVGRKETVNQIPIINTPTVEKDKNNREPDEIILTENGSPQDKEETTKSNEGENTFQRIKSTPKGLTEIKFDTVTGADDVSDFNSSEITTHNEDDYVTNVHGISQDIKDSKIEDRISGATVKTPNEVGFTNELFQITSNFDLETTVDDKYKTLENETRLNPIIGRRFFDADNEASVTDEYANFERKDKSDDHNTDIMEEQDFLITESIPTTESIQTMEPWYNTTFGPVFTETIATSSKPKVIVVERVEDSNYISVNDKKFVHFPNLRKIPQEKGMPNNFTTQKLLKRNYTSNTREPSTWMVFSTTPKSTIITTTTSKSTTKKQTTSKDPMRPASFNLTKLSTTNAKSNKIITKRKDMSGKSFYKYQNVTEETSQQDAAIQNLLKFIIQSKTNKNKIEGINISDKNSNDLISPLLYENELYKLSGDKNYNDTLENSIAILKLT